MKEDRHDMVIGNCEETVELNIYKIRDQFTQ